MDLWNEVEVIQVQLIGGMRLKEIRSDKEVEVTSYFHTNFSGQKKIVLVDRPHKAVQTLGCQSLK